MREVYRPDGEKIAPMDIKPSKVKPSYYPPMTSRQWQAASAQERTTWIQTMDERMRIRLRTIRLPQGISNDDIVQNVWISFFENEERIIQRSPQRNITGTFVRMVQRRVVDSWRREYGEKRLLKPRPVVVYDSDALSKIQTIGEAVEDSALASIIGAGQVRELIEVMGTDAVAQLVFLTRGDLTFAEKGLALGIQEGTARKRKHDLVKRARRTVDPERMRARADAEREKLSLRLAEAKERKRGENNGLSEQQKTALRVYANTPPSSDEMRDVQERIQALQLTDDDVRTAFLFFSPLQRTIANLLYNEDLPLSAIADQVGLGKSMTANALNDLRTGIAGLTNSNLTSVAPFVACIRDYVVDDAIRTSFEENVLRVTSMGEAAFVLLPTTGQRFSIIEKKFGLPKESIASKINYARKNVFTKLLTA